MKSNRVYIILVGSLFALILLMFYSISMYVGSQNDTVQSYTTQQDEIMHDMITDMMSIDETQSADLDYLNGMIPHHKAALEMAEEYLEYDDENIELKQLAQNIINTQSNEINYMKSLANTVTEHDVQKELHYISEYNNAMHSNHAHSDNYRSVAQAFADGMTEHHQMAVSMSEIILKYGDNENVKSLAEDIIKNQQEELEIMSRF